jgi:two-component system response regulator NreC
VLLLDLNMPGKPSLDAIAELSAAGTKTGVVVLTMEDSPEIARRSLAAGAGGYVLKRAAERDLVHAVRAVARGETPGDGRGEMPDGESAGPPGGLTEREAQVLGLIALGHTSSEIGSILSISVRTAESHRAHVQQKLGLSDRPSLVRFALDHGLIPLD